MLCPLGTIHSHYNKASNRGFRKYQPIFWAKSLLPISGLGIIGVLVVSIGVGYRIQGSGATSPIDKKVEAAP
jgi:hypothetical protein